MLPFVLDPGQRPSHDACVYVKVNQRDPDAIQHIVHCVEWIPMCSMIVVDGDREHDGVDNQSSIDVV